MARRFLITFVLALLPVVAIIAHPELRQVMTQDMILLLCGEVDMLAQPHRSSERATILRLESLSGEEGAWRRMEEYAKIARETGKPYLYAAALREGMRSFFEPLQPPLWAKGLFSPPRERQEKHKRTAQRVLAISNEMIEIDKHNAFPYLAKMCALFALGREEAALSALKVAASCPRYVEYDLAWARVLAPRSLTIEARSLAIASVMYLHLAKFRNAMRYARLLADGLQRKGEHARALELREAIAEVGAKMRDSQGVLVTALVGVALQEIAWSGWQKKASRWNEQPVQPVMAAATEFASYARRHGRADLAKTTLQEAVRSQQLKQDLPHYLDVMEELWANLHARTLSMRAAGVIMLLWTLEMLFCLGVSGFLSPWWRYSLLQPDRLSPITSALVVAGAFVAVVVAGLLALDGFGKVWQQWVESQVTRGWLASFPTMEQLVVLHSSGVAILVLLAVTCFALTLFRVARREKVDWLIALGILLGLSLVSIGAAQSHIAVTGYDVVIFVLAFVVLFGGLTGLLASPFYAFVWRKPLPEPFRAAVAAFWGLASVVAWKGLLTGTALWLTAGLVLWLLWARGLPEDTRREMRRAVHRFGMSALILAIFGVWLYALLGYASLPLRAEQHAYLDYIMKHGEMSLLQQFSE
ncbi:MAG: hypothetical protein ACP5RN_08775 [Armatimonadota bacterium]